MDRFYRVGRDADGDGLFYQFDPGTSQNVILGTGSAESVEGDLGVAVGNQFVALVMDHPHRYGRRPATVRIVLLQKCDHWARVEGELVNELLGQRALRNDQVDRTEDHPHRLADLVRWRVAVKKRRDGSAVWRQHGKAGAEESRLPPIGVVVAGN